MLEKDLLNWIIELAERTGWMALHVPAPMVADKKSGQWRPFKRAAGLPDLFLLHDDPARLVVSEVKGDKGKLSERQREVMGAFLTVAQNSWSPAFFNQPDENGLKVTERTVGVYVWTPADQPLIEQILKSKVLI